MHVYYFCIDLAGGFWRATTIQEKLFLKKKLQNGWVKKLRLENSIVVYAYLIGAFVIPHQRVY